MREILFKAKRIDNDEWVEGYYCKWLRGERIITYSEKETDCIITWMSNGGMSRYVDPETICRFTGLYDKNGKKIWENDIVNHNGEYAPVKFGRYCSCFDYGNYNFGFYVDFPEETFYRKELGYWCRKAETAGNVFDNPELLQEESDE